ncbi:Integral membrane protein [hydrothermal vent metagenome]|uniref:Integral membrane protein n=1 Tax=hydrothermal vent metagenome TaxID=652676 RepID=A0A3B0XLK8_9ZZZZ
MDPISQACFGASLSQSLARDKSSQLSALVIGALSGMAADLDVLINSANDPLLFLEFHRQFSHSLFFIPFGALICALAFYGVLQTKPLRTKLSFGQIYLFSFLGYATHGLLDACTSYGTQLYWPFSNARIAWNTVSIIDPLFTLPVIALVVIAARKNKARYAQLAFAYAVLYLTAGLIQNFRAETAIQTLAQQRGHNIERLQVKPSFANRHVWKLIYEYNGRYYIDAVKLLLNTEYIEGTSIEKLNVRRDYPWLTDNSQQRKDIERFRWFSDDFLAVDPDNKDIIMDVRYSFLPNTVKLMWGIELNEADAKAGQLDRHVKFSVQRKVKSETRKEFIEMLF